MITRQQFAEEGRRIKRLKRAGMSEANIKGWLAGWRLVGQRTTQKKSKGD